MSNSGSPGMNKLARVISQRAGQVAGQTEGNLVLDFGSIQSDYSLLTNTFPKSIPKSDYYVCRHISGMSFSSGTADGHYHTVSPTKIKAGDRVLVAWIQNDPVVIDVIKQL